MTDNKPLNLIVTGSRNYPRLQLVETIIYGFLCYPTRKQDLADLYVGNARGVDAEAIKAWRKYTKREPKIFYADWDRFKKAAGEIRNAEMVKAFNKAGAGICLAFWDGQSRGTLHCMKELRKSGRMVLIPEGFLDLNKDLNSGSMALKVWEGEERLA